MEYKIDKEIECMITYDFCKQFVKELHMIYQLTAQNYDYDTLLDNTGGWHAAFTNACRKLGKDDLYKYNYKLEEFVIDDNSHEIGLPDWGKIKKEKEKELKIYCKNCARGEKIISAYDIGKALEYHLSLNNNDYFICESCGKYNFMFNRGYIDRQYVVGFYDEYNCDWVVISSNEEPSRIHKCNIEYDGPMSTLNENSFSTFTVREWILKIVQMQQNDQDFNTPQNSDGQTILMCATKWANCKIMEQILNVKDSNGKRRIDINAQDKNEKTALSFAAEMDDDDKIILLLKNDADMELAKKNISEKARKKLKIIFKRVLKATEDFVMAIDMNNISQVKKLLSSSPININMKVKNPLFYEEPCIALIVAAKNNYKEIVQLLLKQSNIDVNIKDDGGITPLSYSANVGYTEIVELLLKHPNIDVNIQDIEGITPLSIAAHEGRTKIVELLLKHPNIDVNIEDTDRVTALLNAVFNNHIEIIKLLLKHPNININYQDSSGYTALTLASINGNTEIIQLLLNQPDIDVNKKDNNGYAVLRYAISKNNKEVVKILLKYPKIDVNIKDINGYTALIQAVENNYKEIVKILLKHPKIDVNIGDKDGNTALIYALRNHEKEIVELLLNHPNIDVNRKDNMGKNALMYASSFSPLLNELKKFKESSKQFIINSSIYNTHLQIVKLLLKHPNIDVNIQDSKTGWTPLIVSSMTGNKEIFKLLLNHPNININIKDNIGCTALSRAAEAGQEEITEILLNQPGININKQDDQGCTLLIYEAQDGHTGIVKLLLKYPNININIQNQYGSTALIRATIDGHEDVVKLLLNQSNIDVNIQDVEGETALIYSAAYGHTGVAKLLLNHPNIDVNIKDNKKYTAFVHAAISGNNEIFKLLFEQSKVDDIVLDVARRYADIHAYNKVAELSFVLNKAMEYAVIRGHNKIVEMLLNHPNIDIIKEYFCNYVMFAVSRGHEDILKMLLEKGVVNINEKYLTEKFTLLTYAVEEGYAEIVKLLLKQPGIDINVKNVDGETALDFAIRKGRRKIIRLIQSKIVPQSQTQQFESVVVAKESKPNQLKNINKRFIEAVSQGDINEMDTLLEEENPNNGKILVNINARNKNGETALIIASDKGNLEAVRWLLEYKADLTLKDSNGDNALIRGAEKGHLDVVEELLFRKANINSTGQHKKNGIDGRCRKRTYSCSKIANKEES